jgi:hypothetical protein
MTQIMPKFVRKSIAALSEYPLIIRRRLIIILIAYIAVFAPISVACFGLAILFFIEGNVPAFLLMLCLVFPTAFLAVCFQRLMLRRIGSVLLLRRFHKERAPEFPLTRLFEIGVAPIGFPTFTLRDSQIQSSSWKVKLKPDFTGTMLLLCAGFTMLGLVAFITSMKGTVFIYATVGIFLFMSFVFLRARRRERLLTGFLEADRSNQPEITKMVRGIGRHFSDFGINIISTDDNNWQAIVELLAHNVDLIVIDLSQANEHIVWELNKIIELKYAAKIVWACPGRAFDFIKEIDDAHYSVLGLVFEGISSYFEYPNACNPDDYNNVEGLAGISLSSENLKMRIMKVLVQALAKDN